MSAVAGLEPPGVKCKFPRSIAIDVARELILQLAPACLCDRLMVAGSLRRRRLEVGDLELIYIPQIIEAGDPADLFRRKIRCNAADLALNRMLAAGIIEKRLNSLGRTTWGEENKLARHVATGLPVDLFQATPGNWFSLLVCRTGPMESNIRICQAAIARGLHWDPYAGFERLTRLGLAPPKFGELYTPHSEAEVFTFVGLDHRPPRERE